MSISKQKFAAMLTAGAACVIDATDELTAIDAKYGDADHGITMAKIAKTMADAVADTEAQQGIQTMLDNAASAVMMINGGSAVPLWNTLLDGMQQAAPDTQTLTEAQLKAVFRSGLDALAELSGAKVGEKTMMDTIIPAVAAMEQAPDDLGQMMSAAAKAGDEGALATQNYISKYGRAKSYREQTLGTPDAGAMSMKYFFDGLLQGAGE